jgi:hypothetical protein
MLCEGCMGAFPMSGQLFDRLKWFTAKFGNLVLVI